MEETRLGRLPKGRVYFIVFLGSRVELDAPRRTRRGKTGIGETLVE